MGVHRKSSNIGMWGESGRYPLIYQSIKLTLKYYDRLTKMKPGSYVYAALQEQQSLNLSWFKNLEPLLKLDGIYNEDHITAFNAMHSTKREKFPLKLKLIDVQLVKIYLTNYLRLEEQNLCPARNFACSQFLNLSPVTSGTAGSILNQPLPN